ncbi:MAG: 23S rRNA (pseudouridine(1915)-N(3))-methyltransferase RlmH [Bacteroidetes bacterium]|nr:MAG: 23S rRNA (pseudouridine(1915)-N(3))-methyltransferase RlmH [Bacteroidota bacterium]
MTITLICTGKTSEKYVSEGMRLYTDRLKHYCKCSLVEIEAGNGEANQIRKKETGYILKRVSEKDFLILLDAEGKEITSTGFADLLKHHQNISTKHLVFVLGGAYGFSEEVYKRSNLKIALSKMTFPHQLVRIIFLEQLYRAFTILKGEKYHH